MKKTMILAAAMLFAVSSFAQSGESIYGRYSGKEGVEAVYISPSMFEMMGQLPELPMDAGGEKLDLAPIIRSLEGMYILNSSNAEVNAGMGKDVDEMVRKGRFDMLMEARDGSEHVRMYTRPEKNGSDFLNGFMLFVEDGSESIFICIDGRMSRSDFEKLVGAAMQQ